MKKNEDSNFVIIEQDGDGGAFVTHIGNIKEYKEYQSIGDGTMICLKEQDFYNMCQMGVGAG